MKTWINIRFPDWRRLSTLLEIPALVIIVIIALCVPVAQTKEKLGLPTEKPQLTTPVSTVTTSPETGTSRSTTQSTTTVISSTSTGVSPSSASTLTSPGTSTTSTSTQPQSTSATTVTPTETTKLTTPVSTVTTSPETETSSSTTQSTATKPSSTQHTQTRQGSSLTTTSSPTSTSTLTSQGKSTTIKPSMTQPQSTSVTMVTSSTPTTISVCSASDCPPGCSYPCKFDAQSNQCKCQCPEFLFGDTCTIGTDDTDADVDTEALPSRKANLTMGISAPFVPAYEDLNSAESQKIIVPLEQELEALCKQVDPQSYKTIKVVKLLPGGAVVLRTEKYINTNQEYQFTKVDTQSHNKVRAIRATVVGVVAESVVEYNYVNNQTQINFVNNELEEVLGEILNKTSNLEKIGAAINADVTLGELTFQPPEIEDIQDLSPFINCSWFANYTAVLLNDTWQCEGPCKRLIDYCNRNGECQNDITRGPVCSCNRSSLKTYYGSRCDLFYYGPGFYGALFGSLAALLLLSTVIVIAVMVKKNHMFGLNKSSRSFDQQLKMKARGRKK